MRRWLFNILAAVALLLFVATVGLWVRSYWYEDWLHSGDIRWLDSRFGYVQLVTRGVAPPVAAEPWTWESAPAGTRIMWFKGVIFLRAADRVSETHWTMLGLFSSMTTHTLGNTTTLSGSRILTVHYLSIPYWMLCLPTLPLPTFWLTRRLRCRRYPIATCQHCGYDLRASKERCPECGTPIVIAKEATA